MVCVTGIIGSPECSSRASVSGGPSHDSWGVRGDGYIGLDTARPPEGTQQWRD